MISLSLRVAAAALAVVGLWLCIAEVSTWNKVRLASASDLRAAREACADTTALYRSLGKASPFCDPPTTVRSPANLAGLLPGMALVAGALAFLWMASILGELTAIRLRFSPTPSVADPAPPTATNGSAKSPDPQ